MKNSLSNTSVPVISEFRQIGKGIALGELQDTAINAAILALYIVPNGGSGGANELLK